MTRLAGPRVDLTGFLHNACVDLFSEVSGRQPSGRLFFARTSCPDTREISFPLFLPFYLEDHILGESICAGEKRERERGGGRKRAGLETQMFEGQSFHRKSVYLPRSVFWFRDGERGSRGEMHRWNTSGSSSGGSVLCVTLCVAEIIDE